MGTIDHWYADDLWIESLYSDFWLTMSSEAYHRGLISHDHFVAINDVNHPRALPLTRYHARDYHEMAHYIQCADHEVMDPFWGSETWTFRKDDKAWFKDDDFLKELEVFVIDNIIRDMKPHFAARNAAWELAPYMAVEGFSRGTGQAPFFLVDTEVVEPPANLRFAKSLAESFQNKWKDIQTLLAEKNRKDSLVRNRIQELYRLQNR